MPPIRINANAYKLCFWMLAHIIYDKTLFAAIRAEVCPLVLEGTEDLEQRLEKCPHLEAVFHEASRLIASSTTMRTVTQPLQLGGKLFQPGYKIIVPYRQLHIDEQVYGEDVKQFNYSRFLENKDLRRSPSFKPFGGGNTYCPGRFIARREILTFVALALSRFDISLSEAGPTSCGKEKMQRPPFPRVEGKKFCLAMMSPKSGDDVILDIKEVK